MNGGRRMVTHRPPGANSETGLREGRPVPYFLAFGGRGSHGGRQIPCRRTLPQGEDEDAFSVPGGRAVKSETGSRPHPEALEIGRVE